MNDSLEETLRRRAQRAPDADLEQVLTAVHDLAARRRSRRRNLRAAGGGALAVGAVIAGVVSFAIGSTGGPSGLETPAVGPVHGSPGAPAVSSPAPTHLNKCGFDPSKLTGPKQPLPTPAAPPSLVHAAPAPAHSPVSLSLVPDGWSYWGSTPDAVTYGRDGSDVPKDPGFFYNKIGLILEPNSRHSSAALQRTNGRMPIRIAGHPAYLHDECTDWLGGIVWTEHAVVDVQIPAGTGLTRSQVLKMLASIDVRETVVR